MKRKNNLFEQIISFENVLRASKKARKGKRYKASTARFELDLEKNLWKIIEALKNKTYEPGPYFDFCIYDPKTRIISAAPYFDRVIHHALIKVIEPLIGRSFIWDAYACIKGKGTHKAVQRYKSFQKKNRYVLKCDIRKYFLRIDHGILFSMVSRKIKCPDTLWLVKKIIRSRESDREAEYFRSDDLFAPVHRRKGIPIGNLTSQFFANLYLNDFDHFVKEGLRARYYIRYCDDFVLFGNSKKWLNQAKMEITSYLETLRLRLHENKNRIYRVTDGVDFLGYRIFPERILVRKTIVKRYRKRLRKMVLGYREGKIDLSGVNNSIQSWIGHVAHSDSYQLRKEMFSDIVFSR
jgi:retron-type reverse transcriptase